MATMTREEAISALVEKDVAKWGEGEREAARQSRSGLTLGLALNALAHHDPLNVDKTLVAEARKAMTASDRKQLRKGG